MAKNVGKAPEEWFRQAQYDLDTARAMFGAGRYIYTIFMCHLAMEKALKGLYTQIIKQVPPKTHDLLYLVAIIKLKLPEEHENFIKVLNDLSVSTRYPDNLRRLLKAYNKGKTQDILAKTKETLIWLEEKL